ncbi:uncharacterized protein Tco025E_02535 [Trypanosoma conorhini]|uniref:Uncharacterized protein n=1 Tax=Trypanosoma conorhini TaxID=83891 RepID=A0A422Q3G5_9TRYP|nr:uncharacterized protein Tco025E_02535 [Trypanosoma conorhini]RNF24472.1 hypothetical protein Tco025E_02535 [Trypanosoma conorhini]
MMRERREGREPHTFLDSCCLEEQISPRLNELRHHSRWVGDPETTTSTMFNRFSSVSPHQPGISYESAHSSRNGVGHIPQQQQPPPPPPPMPFFLGGGGSGGAGSKFLDWPPPPPATYWSLPQDAPWIPPPPIPQNASGASRSGIGGGAAAKWPTPEDIPLPSTFPFPPYLLPPFPPMPANVDWGQIPPPPPWFPYPQGGHHRQQQQRGQCRGGDTSTLDEAGEDDADDGSQTEPSPRLKGGRGARQKGSARRPSISEQEERHMRSVARGAARRQLQPGVSRCSTRDPPRKTTKDERQERANFSSARGRNAPRAGAASARRLGLPSDALGAVTASSRPASRPIPRDRSRNYYTEAGALKGVPPRLEDAMKGLPSSRSARMSNTSRGPSRPWTPHADVGSKRNNTGHLSNASMHSGVQHANYQEAAKQDERVAEYLKGIEDLYNRLRSSYEDFQRDPSKFIKNASVLKEAALAKAPPPPPQSSLLSPAAVRPSSSPRDFLYDTATVEGKRYDTKSEAQQGGEMPPLSRESQRIREELFKLEMQWQRLEELKRGATGERGAAPMEMLQDDLMETTSRVLHGTGEHRAEPCVGKANGYDRARHNERSRSKRDAIYGNSSQGVSTAEGVGKERPAASILSRSSAPHNTGNQSQNGSLDGGHVGHGNRSVNTSTSSHGPVTRDHVLELVRERKAMLE